MCKKARAAFAAAVMFMSSPAVGSSAYAAPKQDSWLKTASNYIGVWQAARATVAERGQAGDAPARTLRLMKVGLEFMDYQARTKGRGVCTISRPKTVSGQAWDVFRSDVGLLMATLTENGLLPSDCYFTMSDRMQITSGSCSAQEGRSKSRQHRVSVAL